MKRTTHLFVGILLVSGLISGCAGKEGPMGPTGATGASGPGSRVEYSMQILNSYANGYYDLSCPTVTLSSSVTCYIQFNHDQTINVAIPATDMEDDGYPTYYVYAVSNGKIRFGWNNPHGTIPHPTGVVAVVVN